jgi:hypothetical protein
MVAVDNTAHPHLKTAAELWRIQTRVSITGVILIIPEIPGGICPDLN